jgi:hypothetical protein
MALFKDIKQIPHSAYTVSVSWDESPFYINRYVEKYNLDVDPDFQRGYVWTDFQKIKYIEWGLMGGKSGMDIYFNHPNWMGSFNGQMLLIDGKQRLSAVFDFLDNKFPIFDNCFYNHYLDRMSYNVSFNFNVCKMSTRKQILEWYLAMNSGGSIHTEKELEKVQDLLEKETE